MVRMTDDEFWDAAALAALGGVCADSQVDTMTKAAKLVVCAADNLLLERRSRFAAATKLDGSSASEGGAT